MSDLESTKKLIPISILVSILNDDNVFQKFIIGFEKYNDTFEDIPRKQYLEALNNFMKYSIKTDNNLPRKYFEKMNYINTYFNTKVENYSYEQYLERTQKLIPISILHKILEDDQIKDKFLYFEENKDYFTDGSLEDYMSALLTLVDYYEKNNLTMTDEMRKNLCEIKRMHIFMISHNETLTGEIIIKKIDQDLENAILKKVNSNADSFTLARAIYIELCTLTSYDENYDAYKRIDKKSEIAKEIYEKEPEEVTLKENRLVCKTFAEIYAGLLNKIGIKAIIEGNIHKYVLFLYNGIVVKADATEADIDLETGFGMCDINRVKLGLPTVGFEAYDSKNDISYAIRKADLENQEYKQKNLESLENRYRKIKKLDIQKKNNLEEMICYLENVETDKLVGIEYTDYLKVLLTAKLNPETLKNIWYTTCYEKIKDTYQASFAIDASQYSENKNQYYFFHQDRRLEILEANALKQLAEEGKIIITNDTFKKGLEVRKYGTVK